MFTILCLFSLCRNKEYPGRFQKKISKFFFQTSAQIYSVPGETEGRRRPSLEWTSIDLSSKLPLTCGGNVNCYKSVHHPSPTLPVGIGNTLGIFKTNQLRSPFNWVRRYVLFLAKLKRIGRPYLEGKRRGSPFWDYPQEYLVVMRDEKGLSFC